MWQKLQTSNLQMRETKCPGNIRKDAQPHQRKAGINHTFKYFIDIVLSHITEILITRSAGNDVEKNGILICNSKFKRILKNESFSL